MKVPYIDLQRWHQQLKPELMDAFSRVVDHGGYCLGPEVEAFERGFAESIGAERCVAMGSGTEALHVAALALGIGPGDEVIVPAFTFIASAWLAQYVGAKVVYADVELDTFAIDPHRIEELITEKTKAIVAVHLYGQTADMDAIMAIARKHNLKVVEDAAQAYLAYCGDQPVGLIGDIGIYSFYPTKNLGALGEGGALVSRHPEIIEKALMYRAHGSKERYLNHLVGYNYRMEGLQAATLGVKLPRMKGKTARRQQIARKYLGGIRLKDAQLPQPSRRGESVYHVFTVLHPERDRLRAFLAEKGIGTDVVYPIPLHLQPCFAFLGYKQGDFPNAEQAASQCVSLPIFPELTDEEIDYVIQAINAFV